MSVDNWDRTIREQFTHKETEARKHKTRQRIIAAACVVVLILSIAVTALVTHVVTENRTQAAAQATSQTVRSPEQQVKRIPVSKTPADYYFSPERRALLADTVDQVGRVWLDRMLSGKIPWETRGWDKFSPAPYNGYGSIVSTPSTGPGVSEMFINVIVRFVNGRIDMATGPLGIFVMKDGRMADLIGLTTVHGWQALPVNDSPTAFSWYLEPSDEVRNSLPEDKKYGSKHLTPVMVEGTAHILPARDAPIDHSKTYEIMLSDPAAADDYRAATIFDIALADDSLIDFLNSVAEVTSSNW